jgi:CheY-like chemotaxis protein
LTEKVLIVDDEEDVLQSTEMLVNLLHYEAIAVRDPGRVIEIAEAQHPGVILQDLKMRDLNVAGLMASLRSNPKTADIPVIFFSANTDLPAIAAKLDAWGFLPKPFTERELAQVLDRAMHGKQNPAMGDAREVVKRELRQMFHDYWNLIAGLNNYAEVLRQSPTLGPLEKKAVAGIDDIILKVESKTDRMRSYLGMLFG